MPTSLGGQRELKKTLQVGANGFKKGMKKKKHLIINNHGIIIRRLLYRGKKRVRGRGGSKKTRGKRGGGAVMVTLFSLCCWQMEVRGASAVGGIPKTKKRKKI